MMSARAALSFCSISARDQLAIVVVDRDGDAVFLEAQHAQARLPAAVLGALHRVIDREVDALDHRGEDRAGMQVVLVAVDADRELAAVLRRLQHAQARGARRRIDDIGAAIELAARQLAALGRIVPGRRRRAGHVLEDLDLRVGVFGALFVAEREFADQRNVHAADEADLAGLGGHRRRHADQEGALMLLVNHRLHVGQVDHRVDDGEFDRREFLGDLLEPARLREADAHHHGGAAPRHVAQRLLALGSRSVTSNSRYAMPDSFL